VARTPFPLRRRIGRVLRARTEALNLSQENVAEKVGKHRVDYWRIENGKVNIRLDTLEKISTALRARPWEILKAADEEMTETRDRGG
jgi:transcriptional regulator with XRE-family HTH domain